MERKGGSMGRESRCREEWESMEGCRARSARGRNGVAARYLSRSGRGGAMARRSATPRSSDSVVSTCGAAGR